MANLRKERAAENAGYVFTAYAMAILKLQFWHITGWLEFAELGMKPDDLIGAWACSACHDEIDRRTIISTTKTPDFTTSKA